MLTSWGCEWHSPRTCRPLTPANYAACCAISPPVKQSLPIRLMLKSAYLTQKLTNPTLSYPDQPYTCLKKSNYGKRLAGWTPKEIILFLQDPVLSEDDLINICPNESPLINPFQKTTHIPTPNFSWPPTTQPWTTTRLSPLYPYLYRLTPNLATSTLPIIPLITPTPPLPITNYNLTLSIYPKITPISIPQNAIQILPVPILLDANPHQTTPTYLPSQATALNSRPSTHHNPTAII